MLGLDDHFSPYLRTFVTISPSRRLAELPLAGALLLGSAAVALPADASTTANEIVYVVDDATASKVVVRNLLTRTEQVIRSAAISANTTFDGPELSPDGTKVVVAEGTFSDTGASTQRLVVIDRASKAITELAKNTSGATDTTSRFDVLPTVSPNGSTVLWTHATVTQPTTTTGTPTIATELRTEPITGNAVPAIVNGSAGTAAGAYRPDGAALVVTQPTAPLNSTEGPLSLLDPATGTLMPLNVSGDEPVFSPDSTTLAFAKTIGTGAAAHSVIATAPATGGASTVLPSTSKSTATNASTPGWSPDGESLVYDLQNNTANTLSVWATDRAGVRAGQVLGSTSADYSTPAFNGPAPAPVSTDGVKSSFTPVTPTRLLDTRTANGGHQGKVGKGGSVTLTVAGRVAGGTTIPADATAIVLNVTVVNGTLPTVVRVYPAPASPVPSTSSLNTTQAGQVIAYQVTVKLPPAGPDAGKVVLYNGAGTVDLLADVAGFYSPSGANHFQPVDPARILDSRNGTGTSASAFTIAPRDVAVTGTLPVSGGGTVAIPSTATAVVLNVTATATSTNTFVRVYPTPAAPGPLPTVSSLNVAKGKTAANLVTVAVGNQGRVRFQNAAGTAQLIADIAGYYDPSAPGFYVPVTPIRFLDTRSGTGAAPIPTTGGTFVDLLVAGTRGIPSTALAAVLNLTGTATSTSTIIRAYPSTSATVPTVSNLNLVKADSRANAAVVKPGTTGRVRLLNGAGSVQLIADVAGYFVPGP